MKFLFIITLVIISNYTKSFGLEEKNLKISFIAFKTLKKLGVKGTFKLIDLNIKSRESDNIKKLLTGIKVIIKTNSVSTGHTGRDNNLKNYFFPFLGKTINGEVINYDKNSKILKIKISFKNVSKIIPFVIETNNQDFKAIAYIDLYDFMLEKALKSINKQCLSHHKGKTWNDVKIIISNI